MELCPTPHSLFEKSEAKTLIFVLFVIKKRWIQIPTLFLYARKLLRNFAAASLVTKCAKYALVLEIMLHYSFACIARFRTASISSAVIPD